MEKELKLNSQTNNRVLVDSNSPTKTYIGTLYEAKETKWVSIIEFFGKLGWKGVTRFLILNVHLTKVVKKKPKYTIFSLSEKERKELNTYTSKLRAKIVKIFLDLDLGIGLDVDYVIEEVYE